MSGRPHRVACSLIAAGAASVALSGCGISHPGMAAAPAATPAAVAAAHDSARAMFKEMTHALRRVRSVSIDFSVKLNKGQVTRIDTELQLPGRVEATVMYGGEIVNERWIGDDVYFRYNISALEHLTGNPYLADILHDRWIELPNSIDPFSSSMEHMATAKMLQMCDIFGPTGRLSLGGTTTLNGLSAVTLRDAGNRPGTAKSTITLSANPPYLPLQIVQTHPNRPGGASLQQCFNTRTARTLMRRAEQVASRFDKRHHIKLKRAVESITDYDSPLHLVKPPHAIAPKGDVQSTSSSVSL